MAQDDTPLPPADSMCAQGFAAGEVLHREMLLGDGLSAMVARCASPLKLRSPAERQASLAETMALRPAGEAGRGVWVFGYGSLIWNPIIHHDDRRVAVLEGFHRAFCLGTPAGRGTPDNPGLVLGLTAGGMCEGVAFHVAEADLAGELDLLWRREMLADGYDARWVTLRDQGSDGERSGGRFPAIGFVVNHKATFYAGDLPEEETVRRLATARGELGSSAEYLLRTRDGLRQLGLHDRLIERLAERVAAFV
jgi:cation transport protein ChaC